MITDQEYSKWLKRIGVGVPNTPIKQLTALLLLHKVFDEYEKSKKNPGREDELMN